MTSMGYRPVVIGRSKAEQDRMDGDRKRKLSMGYRPVVIGRSKAEQDCMDGDRKRKLEHQQHDEVQQGPIEVTCACKYEEAQIATIDFATLQSLTPQPDDDFTAQDVFERIKEGSGMCMRELLKLQLMIQTEVQQRMDTDF